MQLSELDTPISEAVPHIFKRPLLYVSSSDPLLQVATFLAIGPQIYVDGLVVVEGHKSVGTIGGQHLIKHILNRHERWLNEKASGIVSNVDSSLDADEPLKAALDIFAKTRFGFSPITINGKVVTSLSLRDILKFVERSKSDIHAEKLSSPLIYINKDASIGNALEVMIEKNIRNLAIRSGNSGKSIIAMVNDRKILEFLASHDGLRMIASASDGFKGLFDTRIDILDMLEAQIIRPDLPLNILSKFFNINTPCLLLHNSIVTPWDVVMKGFRRSKQ